ncbi:hypothetical protein B9Z55_004577 [Caenorhabditis nigoni]|uniref:Uncharacterized protein n=1 Tax=Caenorhabditis nigoni TaxID=1611254 RepID=A0A2G5UX15_9PELO|nr:hypothetical protein B9Z55_004577 [Caenorhabditis nigoni]
MWFQGSWDGWDPINSTTLASLLDDDHRDSQRIDKKVGFRMLEGVGCCQLPGSFGCASNCYFYLFRSLIDVIEVKKKY